MSRRISSGATAVLDTTPAAAPAIRCRAAFDLSTFCAFRCKLFIGGGGSKSSRGGCSDGAFGDTTTAAEERCWRSALTAAAKSSAAMEGLLPRMSTRPVAEMMIAPNLALELQVFRDVAAWAGRPPATWLAATSAMWTSYSINQTLRVRGKGQQLTPTFQDTSCNAATDAPAV